MSSKKQQSLDDLNSYDDEILPSWIEKFKLQYGLVIDERGVKKGNVQPIQTFSSSTNPKINKINPTDSIKTNLTITNSLLHSYLLKSDIKDINDEMIKSFSQEVPFINLKVKDSWNFGPEQKKVKDSWNLESEQNIEDSWNLESEQNVEDLWNLESGQKVKDSWNLDVEDSWNLKFKQTIHYEISSQQIELIFENFIPSNKLTKAVQKALNTENPYHELEIIFSKYGHLLCKKIILGGKLSRSQHLDLNENLFTERKIEKKIDPLSINNNKELDEILIEWDEIHGKINDDFNFDNKIFFNINGFATKRNSVIEWIKIMPENLKIWDVIYYADLIPLYKILEESLQKEIELLFKNQILMMDSIKIEDKNIKYYRVDFKTPLKSDKYQIYGTIFNENLEKCFDIIIKFKYFDQYGFSTIIEKFDGNQNVSRILWAMVGSPMEVGFYSKDTRKLEMMNSEESSGTDLGDIFNTSSLNNFFGGEDFGYLLDDRGNNVENTVEIAEEKYKE
ncbi:22259_t:CDS:2, partial [Entrophospora sp. SA101]